MDDVLRVHVIQGDENLRNDLFLQKIPSKHLCEVLHHCLLRELLFQNSLFAYQPFHGASFSVLHH